MVTVKDHIRSILYFEGIAEDELAYVAENSLMRTFTAGEMIFLEGEPADGLWIVEKGNVKVFKLNPEGGEHILHQRGPGRTLSDIAALAGGRTPAQTACPNP